MAFKTITIKERVYKELKSVKGKDESFSRLLERLVKSKKPGLKRYYGAWKGDKKEFEKIEKTLGKERLEKETRPDYSISLE